MSNISVLILKILTLRLGLSYLSDGGLTLSGLDTSNPKDNTDVNFVEAVQKSGTNQFNAGDRTLKIEKNIHFLIHTLLNEV